MRGNTEQLRRSRPRQLAALRCGRDSRRLCPPPAPPRPGHCVDVLDTGVCAIVPLAGVPTGALEADLSVRGSRPSGAASILVAMPRLALSFLVIVAAVGNVALAA